jgi:hypothetical protein
VTVRERRWVPPPQVLEHVDQATQSETAQSKGQVALLQPEIDFPSGLCRQRVVSMIDREAVWKLSTPHVAEQTLHALHSLRVQFGSKGSEA